LKKEIDDEEDGKLGDERKERQFV